MQIMPGVTKTKDLSNVFREHKAHYSLEQVRKLLKSGEQKGNWNREHKKYDDVFEAREHRDFS